MSLYFYQISRASKGNLVESGLCDERLFKTGLAPLPCSVHLITVRVNGDKCMPKVCFGSWWETVAIGRAC